MEATDGESVMASSSEFSTWGDQDPSVFVLYIPGTAIVPEKKTIEVIESVAKILKEPSSLEIPSVMPSPQPSTHMVNREILNNYFRVRFKSITTGRYLNGSNGGGDWIRNKSATFSENQTFNLRKISKNKIAIEISGWWITLVRNSYDSKFLLSASSRFAGKDAAFEIRPQPYQWHNVRVKASNDNFIQLQKGVADYWVPSADLPNSTIWDDGSAFLMEITQGNTNSETYARHGSPLDNIRPLDGTKAQFKSAYLKKFLWGRGSLVADEPLNNSNWATFKLWGIPGTNKLVIQASSGQFVGLDGTSRLVLGRPEPFEILNRDYDFDRVRIKASKEKFLKANEDGSVTADATKWVSWEDDDPTAFLMTITGVVLPDDTTIIAIEEMVKELTKPDVVPPRPPPPPPPLIPVPLVDPTHTEFFDGVRVQFQSASEKKYLCAEKDGVNAIMASRAKALRWETFKLWRITERTYQIQAFNWQFIGLNKPRKNSVMANSSEPGPLEIFQILKVAEDPTRVRIKAPNGSFLQVKSDGSVAADFPSSRKWVIDDASVFLVSTVTEKEWDDILSKDTDEDGDLQSIGSIRALNLGGWLVANSAIKPSLFDGILNKDLLDGTEVQLRSLLLNKYLSAQLGGGANINAAASEANECQTFTLWRISENSFHFRAPKGQFVGLDTPPDDGNIVAISDTPGMSETFEVLCDANGCPEGTLFVQIKAYDGRFVQANRDGTVQAFYSRSLPGNQVRRENDPSFFLMTIINRFRGEFQLVNGYGAKATDVMRDHWKSFVGEKDFRSIREQGLEAFNAVRIPVGWWIASDPIPPWPFVGGSLNALDQAFSWAEDYDLAVIVSLCAAPGSQNGLDQSGSRDNHQEWGKTDDSIDRTVQVIEFLTARYADRENLIAIELLDKPIAPKVTLESLIKYYKKGYDAVRRYTSRAYVIMSNRLYADSTELLDFASSLKGSVVNVHYDDLFSGTDSKDLAAELKALTKPNGPPIFIGEWTAKWEERRGWRRAGKEDYQKSAKEKLEALELATFGWAFWTLKTDQKNGVWSEWQTWAKLHKEVSHP